VTFFHVKDLHSVLVIPHQELPRFSEVEANFTEYVKAELCIPAYTWVLAGAAPQPHELHKVSQCWDEVQYSLARKLLHIMSSACQNCGKFEIVCFCVCTEVGLCAPCSSLHAEHLLLPLHVFGQHRDPAYQAQVKERLASMTAAQAAYERNLAEITQCQAQFEGEVNRLITEMYEHWGKQTDQLNEMRATLERDWLDSVTEAQTALYEAQPQLRTKFAQLLLEFEGTDLQVFSYRYDSEGAKEALQRFCKFTVQVPSGAGLRLAAATGNSLQVYNLKSGKQVTSQLPVAFTDGTVLAQLRVGLLAAGGRPATSAAFLSQGQAFTALPNMNTSRGFPGVFVTGEAAYLFGGFDHSKGFPDCFLKAAEKFTVQTRTWTALMSMNFARHMFTPCAYKREVLLVETCLAGNGLEAFNLDTESYRPLTVKQPFSRENSVAVVCEGEILLISYTGQLARWRVDSPDKKFAVTKLASFQLKPQANGPFLEFQSRFYFIHFATGELGIFDPAAQTLVKA